ncbi:FAD/NAD(P)-binding oxidoreductase [Micromonospora sp. b486]|uniref:NAD(P)/FAD-dependent oxidoreductase n=1 Tax=Micromonospora sp. b486 TaxID=3053986 RepID=UPI00259CB0EF|nr:FAD/NAD(P)-binding oxidoreductase [Micromonospora sp. b486]MDM4784660.1 FAD/NAD(P)-binding oxidoreductase [Micromonospora sp. b486]
MRYESQLVEVDGDSRRAVILDSKSGTKESIDYDLLHAVPPQSAPAWLKDSALAILPARSATWQFDQYSLQSTRWPDVFALGDVANLPTSKTGAAIRKQAPMVVANSSPRARSEPLPARYDGYTSCPRSPPHRMLLAEFDYQLKPTPSFR